MRLEATPMLLSCILSVLLALVLFHVPTFALRLLLLHMQAQTLQTNCLHFLSAASERCTRVAHHIGNNLRSGSYRRRVGQEPGSNCIVSERTAFLRRSQVFRLQRSQKSLVVVVPMFRRMSLVCTALPYHPELCFPNFKIDTLVVRPSQETLSSTHILHFQASFDAVRSETAHSPRYFNILLLFDKLFYPQRRQDVGGTDGSDKSCLRTIGQPVFHSPTVTFPPELDLARFTITQIHASQTSLERPLNPIPTRNTSQSSTEQRNKLSTHSTKCQKRHRSPSPPSPSRSS